MIRSGHGSRILGFPRSIMNVGRSSWSRSSGTPICSKNFRPVGLVSLSGVRKAIGLPGNPLPLGVLTGRGRPAFAEFGDPRASFRVLSLLPSSLFGFPSITDFTSELERRSGSEGRDSGFPGHKYGPS